MRAGDAQPGVLEVVRLVDQQRGVLAAGHAAAVHGALHRRPGPRSRRRPWSPSAAGTSRAGSCATRSWHQLWKVRTCTRSSTPRWRSRWSMRPASARLKHSTRMGLSAARRPPGAARGRSGSWSCPSLPRRGSRGGLRPACAPSAPAAGPSPAAGRAAAVGFGASGWSKSVPPDAGRRSSGNRCQRMRSRCGRVSCVRVAHGEQAPQPALEGGGVHVGLFQVVAQQRLRSGGNSSSKSLPATSARRRRGQNTTPQP